MQQTEVKKVKTPKKIGIHFISLHYILIQPLNHFNSSNKSKNLLDTHRVFSKFAMAWFRNLTQVSSSSLLKQHHHHHIHPFSLLSPLASSLSHSHYTTEAPPTQYAGLGPTRPEEKPRVVVLGSGWAGCRFMKGIDTNIYDVVCVSPRNHMVFTPLLASTCVGTLEFRSVAEPIGRIQPAISREPGSYFFLSNCTAIDIDNHMVIFVLFYWCILLFLFIVWKVFE